MMACPETDTEVYASPGKPGCKDRDGEAASDIAPRLPWILALLRQVPEPVEVGCQAAVSELSGGTTPDVGANRDLFANPPPSESHRLWETADRGPALRT